MPFTFSSASKTEAVGFALKKALPQTSTGSGLSSFEIGLSVPDITTSSSESLGTNSMIPKSYLPLEITMVLVLQPMYDMVSAADLASVEMEKAPF